MGTAEAAQEAGPGAPETSVWVTRCPSKSPGLSLPDTSEGQGSSGRHRGQCEWPSGPQCPQVQSVILLWVTSLLPLRHQLRAYLKGPCVGTRVF